MSENVASDWLTAICTGEEGVGSGVALDLVSLPLLSDFNELGKGLASTMRTQILNSSESLATL